MPAQPSRSGLLSLADVTNESSATPIGDLSGFLHDPCQSLFSPWWSSSSSLSIRLTFIIARAV